LDFLGVVRPNRDFSKGYGQKNKKIDSRLRLCAIRLKAISHPFSSLSAGGEDSMRPSETCSIDFWLLQDISVVDRETEALTGA
jgi:hypothetical protein